MKKQKKFWFLLILFSLLLLTSCESGEARSARHAAQVQLEELTETNSEEILSYLKTGKFSSVFTEENSSTASDIGNIFTLFYDHFSYEIGKVTVKDGKASAKLRLTTLDMQKVAKDYVIQSLKKRITLEATPSSVDFSLKDSYLLLEELLKTKDYPLTESSAVMELEKDGEDWKVLHTEELDDALTGNFRQYMMDSSLLSPSEIVETHFQTIKDFDSEQLKIYLSLDQLLDTDSEYNRSISHAMAEQIHHLFDYEILEETVENTDAEVEISITSADFQSILDTYKSRLSQWLQTSESLAVGVDGRRAKERTLLLTSIEENQATVSHKIRIHLENDGVNWKIQMDSDIAQAVFGDIQNTMTPVFQEVE